ncbi:hypothetical protein LguiB_016777 [Lonicera macranthoides]
MHLAPSGCCPGVLNAFNTFWLHFLAAVAPFGCCPGVLNAFSTFWLHFLVAVQGFCDKVATCSYTRVGAHLLRLKCQWIKKCPNVTIDDISKRQKLDEEAKLRLNKSPNLAQRLALPPPNVSFGCISTFVQGGDKSKKRKTSPSSSRSRNENPTEATNYATARDQWALGLGHLQKRIGDEYCREFSIEYAKFSIMAGVTG